MDITRMKAKRDLVLYEKMKDDWGTEEHIPCCKTHDRNLQHGFIWKFGNLGASGGGRIEVDVTYKKIKKKQFHISFNGA
jgi:hypothetical protein